MATSKKKKPEPELPEVVPTHWYPLMLYQVRKASIQPPKTKAEIVAWYQAHYTGKGAASWKQRLVNDLAKITGMKTKNLERRFDPSRINNVPRRKLEQDQYKALGAQIGVQPPPYGYKVEFDGWIHWSTCEKRSFTVTITGQWAAQVAKNPPLIEPAMLLVYMEEDDQSTPIAEQEPSVGICVKDQEAGVNDPKVTVTANDHEVKSGHSGPARRFSFFGR